MRQRDKQAPLSAEERVRDIRRASRRHSQPRRRSALCSMACAAKTASLSSAARKVSLRTSTTVGPRSSSRPAKKRLAGDTAREASSDEVKTLRAEARQLKEALAEVTLENRLLKKSVIADGEDIE